MDKLTKMSEADEIIRKLNTEQRDYLNRYFAHAPESVTGSMQVVRMPEGTTFIQEGMPVDKVYVLLKGCVSAVDYRVRETVYGFCHFNPIEIPLKNGFLKMWMPCRWRQSGLSGICWISPEKSDFMYCFPEMNGFISSLQICMRPTGSSILTVCI